MHSHKHTHLPSNATYVTYLKWSCNATFRSKESDLSAKPIPINALLPDRGKNKFWIYHSIGFQITAKNALIQKFTTIFNQFVLESKNINLKD